MYVLWSFFTRNLKHDIEEVVELIRDKQVKNVEV